MVGVSIVWAETAADGDELKIGGDDLEQARGTLGVRFFRGRWVVAGGWGFSVRLLGLEEAGDAIDRGLVARVAWGGVHGKKLKS